MSNELCIKESFWKEFSNEYFDLTHLHGFKELSISNSKTEKILWTFIIITAFAFTGYLIYQSVKDSLEDKMQTVVDYNKYGNISLPLLYCPRDWIDGTKMDQFNVSTTLYAMSFFRTLMPTYMSENNFLSQYHNIDITKVQFCNTTNNSETEIPALVILCPFIETKCLYSNDYFHEYALPEYYKLSSQYLIEKLSFVTKVVDTSNVNLMIKIFEATKNDNCSLVWRILYDEFFLSSAAKHELENNLNFAGLKRNLKNCDRENYTDIITLRDLDILSNDSRMNCSDLLKIDSKEKVAFEHKTDLCSIYNDLIIFYMFNGDSIRKYECIRCYAFYYLEEWRSNKLWEIIQSEKEYSIYLRHNGLNASHDTFKTYINSTGHSFTHQNAEIIKIRNWAEEEFKKSEKPAFYNDLKVRNFTDLFDFLKAISYDETKFLLTMSVDPILEIRPRSGDITVEKVVNAYGVCYLFKINADMKPLPNLPIDFNNIDKLRNLYEKLYVNIVELKHAEKPPFWPRENPANIVLVIGSEAKNLIPRKRSFDIKRNDDAADYYYSFQVYNLASRSSEFIESEENMKYRENVDYTHSNCIASCFNKYSQPKYIDGSVHRKVHCQYIAESMFDIDRNDQCSFFTEINQELSFEGNNVLNGNTVSQLDECNDKCKNDDELLTFDVTWSMNNSTENIDTPDSVNERLSLNDLYQLKSDNSPFWIRPPLYDGFHGLSTYNMIKRITTASKKIVKPIARMEIQINSDVTTYETTRAKQWYNFLADVGGQINLVISGSLLTVLQLIWWFTHFSFEYYRMQKPDPVYKGDVRLVSLT